MILRSLAAAVLAVHGLIHLIGFLVPWRIAQVEGFAYRTTALGGSVELGATEVMIVGLAWLAIAVGFAAAAVGVWRRSAWALGLTAALATASLVVCVLGLPETVAGIVVNVAILTAAVWVAFMRRADSGSVAERGQRWYDPVSRPASMSSSGPSSPPPAERRARDAGDASIGGPGALRRGPGLQISRSIASRVRGRLRNSRTQPSLSTRS